MWLGPIQNTAFAQRTLQSLQGQQQDYGTWARMQGMLTLAAQVGLVLDELPRVESTFTKRAGLTSVTKCR